MYKILILKEDYETNLQINNIVTYVNEKTIFEVLENDEYDLIYIDNKYRNRQIEQVVNNNYMVLPEAIKKLTINNDIDNTFINLSMINLLIRNNVQIIEFKDYFEEIILSSVVKEMLKGYSNIEKICTNVYSNKKEIKHVKTIIKKIICKHYAGDSKMRKFKYMFFKSSIEKKFFNSILNNIYEDVKRMPKISKNDL